MMLSWMAIALGMLGMLTLCLLAVVIVLSVAIRQRSTRDRQRTERVSRELERINAMAAGGRISAEEAAELRLALEDQRLADEGGPARGRLQKSRNPVLFGVCGGLAEWLRWDPTLFRLGYTLATLMIAGFPGIIAYIILAVVMPEAQGTTRSAGKTVMVTLLVLLVPVVILGLLAVYIGCMRVCHTMGGMPAIQRLH